MNPERRIDTQYDRRVTDGSSGFPARARDIASQILVKLLHENGPDSPRFSHIAGIEQMHFGDASTCTGSVIFTRRPKDPKCLEDIVIKYIAQRLERGDTGDFLTFRQIQDDRKALVKLGASNDAFLPGYSYHLVKNVAGLVRSFPLKSLAECIGQNATLSLEENVKGTISLVVQRNQLNRTVHDLLTDSASIAIFLVGPRDPGMGEGLTIWTAHAGVPMKPVPCFFDRKGNALPDDQVPTNPDERASRGIVSPVYFASQKYNRTMTLRTDTRAAVVLTCSEAIDTFGGDGFAVSIRT